MILIAIGVGYLTLLGLVWSLGRAAAWADHQRDNYMKEEL